MGKSILKQASILVFASFLVRFMGFLYRIPLTRMLGDTGNSYYSSGYYFYTFFLVMSSAGLPAAIAKMVAARNVEKKYRESHKIFKISLAFAAVTGTASMFILWNFADVLANSIKIPESAIVIKTLAPTVLLVSIMACYRGYFQGMKTTGPTAVSQIIEQIFNAIFSVLMAYVLVDKGLEYGAAGGTSGTGIGALCGLITIVAIYFINRNAIIKRTEFNDVSTLSTMYLLKELVFTAIPIIAGTAIFSITNIIDMRMVMSRLLASGAFSYNDATELYGQLSGKYTVLVTLPVSISTGIATASIPNISALKKGRKYKELNEKINSLVKSTMIICVPAAFGIGILADPILFLLFPTTPEGGVLLRFGSLSIIFLSLCQILTGVLQGFGKIRVPVVSAICGAVVKILLSYVLIAIPSINIVGAIVSTIFCYLVASSLNYYFLKLCIPTKLRYRSIFKKPIIASIAMSIVVLIVYNLTILIGGMNWTVNAIAVTLGVVLGGGTYFITLIKIRGISERDLSSIPFVSKILIKFMK
ncbi:MAG: oligosaccharide flippase family protein [Lachnospirales bacterium]